MKKRLKQLLVCIIMVSVTSTYVFAFCNHAGGTLIMSYTTCEKVDDIRHINYDVEVRKPCINCGEQYTNKRPIGGDGFEYHYAYRTEDAGHGVGDVHYFREYCKCGYYSTRQYTCYGPPCRLLQSLPNNTELD